MKLNGEFCKYYSPVYYWISLALSVLSSVLIITATQSGDAVQLVLSVIPLMAMCVLDVEGVYN